MLEMPALSPTMRQGNIATWLKAEGDSFGAGDILVDIETDKATVGYECQEDGFLAKILAPNGAQGVEVGSHICITVEEAEDVAAFKDYVAGAAPAAASPQAATPTPEVEAQAPKGRRAMISFRHGQRPSEATEPPQAAAPPVQQTGGPPKPATSPSIPTPARTVVTTPRAADAYTDVPLTAMRKIIAERLLESKNSIPHYYVSVDCEMDKLMQARKDINTVLEPSGVKVSVNDFIIKASALALRAVPKCNASFFDTFIREYDYVDISVAVSTPTGLITPIVTDVDRKGLSAISENVKDLAGRAKTNKLLPNEFQGGTFTISNMGMMGVNQFTAIINPPQSCILAVGATKEKILPANNAAGFRKANVMTVTLSSDHRVVDGALAAQWCKSFQSFVENPALMVI